MCTKAAKHDMENLGLWIYLFSIVDGIIALSIVVLVISGISIAVILLNKIETCNEEKILRYDGIIRKSCIIAIICALFIIVIPSKKDLLSNSRRHSSGRTI